MPWRGAIIGWLSATLAACSGGQPGGDPAGALPEPLISSADKFFAVHAIDRERAVVIGYGGKILLTEDGGIHWTQPPSSSEQALYAVHFVGDAGWISGAGGIVLHSADGGRIWQRQDSRTNVPLFGLHFADARHGWAVGDKSIVVATADAGRTWTRQRVSDSTVTSSRIEEPLVAEEPLGSPDAALYDVRFVDAKTGWVSGELGLLFHTSDGGATWNAQQDSLLGQGISDLLDIPTFFGIDFRDAAHGFAVGLHGTIVHTTDGGKVWQLAALPLDTPIEDPLFTIRVFGDGSGWASGAAGEVLHRDGPTLPWRRVDVGVETVPWWRGMAWLDESNGWLVGGHGLILHTTDGGRSWIRSMT